MAINGSYETFETNCGRERVSEDIPRPCRYCVHEQLLHDCTPFLLVAVCLYFVIFTLYFFFFLCSFLCFILVFYLYYSISSGVGLVTWVQE